MSGTTISLKPTILVVPLDWGLGHATRCIPLIQWLLHQNCTVRLAGEGKVKDLLQNEFPQLVFLPLPGYRIRYSKTKWLLPFTLAAQLPKMLAAIKQEQAWLQNAVKEYGIDAVISDNRYGLYHTGVPCVFITHQLSIQTRMGKIADAILQKLNYSYINRFSECWVPDMQGAINLAGRLSHPARLPAVPAKYIGVLSRFVRSGVGNSKHILVLLSGPEPQRTVLENLLLPQLETYSGKVVFVRGLPGSAEVIPTASNIAVYNHLPAEALQQKMLEATFVIGRCGYSTVMDIAALQKKSILIPTPGQTEQEYLARHLLKTNFALCIAQEKFSLEAALERATAFSYNGQSFSAESTFHNTLSNFVASLQPQGTPPANFAIQPIRGHEKHH